MYLVCRERNPLHSHENYLDLQSTSCRWPHRRILGHQWGCYVAFRCFSKINGKSAAANGNGRSSDCDAEHFERDYHWVNRTRRPNRWLRHAWGLADGTNRRLSISRLGPRRRLVKLL